MEQLLREDLPSKRGAPGGRGASPGQSSGPRATQSRHIGARRGGPLFVPANPLGGHPARALRHHVLVGPIATAGQLAETPDVGEKLKGLLEI
eukprot:9147569-Alexandrium_andersonii.AAC.1